jgi:ABC-type microcin C transport system permease subunit YejB
LKIQEDKSGEGLVSQVESVSGEIQLLALNIAVAAAKIAHKQDLGIEVNQRLSQLVNQATQAVKQMNQVLNAARNCNGKKSVSHETDSRGIDSQLIESIETSMQSIMSDSERIVRLLAGVKRR